MTFYGPTSQKSLHQHVPENALEIKNQICYITHTICGVGISVLCGLPKPKRRVRLPYPAPQSSFPLRVRSFLFVKEYSKIFLSRSIIRSALFFFAALFGSKCIRFGIVESLSQALLFSLTSQHLQIICF